MLVSTQRPNNNNNIANHLDAVTATPVQPDNASASISAAALNIKVGSFHDPSHLQGLAHLCEHVLFTGSEAFPTESYSGFIGT